MFLLLYVCYFLLLQFYVAEGCLEVFARHMLFLALLFEPPDELGLQGTCTMYYRSSQLHAQSTVVSPLEIFLCRH